LFGERSADFTEADALARFQKGFRELLDHSGIGLNDVECDALRGARADAGEFGQSRDKGRNSRWEHGLNQ
jgi:hypothetical protein